MKVVLSEGEGGGRSSRLKAFLSEGGGEQSAAMRGI